VVGLVDEKGLATEIVGQGFGSEPVQCRMGTRKSMVERSSLA